MVLGGGIGNIVQATPAIKAIAEEGHHIDLNLHCNSSNEVKRLFEIPGVCSVYMNAEKLDRKYDFQLNGPFTPGKKHTKIVIKPRFHYAKHRPEAEVYYDLAKQIGIKTPMGDAEINIGEHGWIPDSESVAIYSGSKPDWAMKRWDKYDVLARKFKKVMLVGTREDIDSHGNPTWITRPFKWPSHCQKVIGPIQNVAYTISKCKMFIGNDGGLAHVAAATGVPTFVLFGPSSDKKNKPYAKNAHVIAIDLPCRPCQFAKRNGQQIFDGGKGNCYLNMKCMREMSVDFVVEKINEYMERQK